MEALDAVRAHMRGLRPPGHHEKVFKDECMFSFSSPESPGGLYINLKTFQVHGIFNWLHATLFEPGACLI